MQGYIGSVAFTAGQHEIAVTSPRGGQVQMFDVARASFLRATPIADVCGVAPCRGGLLVASGSGDLYRLAGGKMASTEHPALMWDNHLVAL